MRFFYSLILSSIFLASCGESVKNKNSFTTDKYELLDIDKAFSSLSREKGMKAAFIEFIDSNGVLLLPGQMPVEGANAIDYLISQDDSGYQLSWKPRDGFISASGDMGYTFGIYQLQMKNSETSLTGNYMTVWKKQQDGKWKFVLYSGNQAAEEAADR